MKTIRKSAGFRCRICGYDLYETNKVNEYLCSGCGSVAHTFWIDGELDAIYSAPKKIPEKRKEKIA